MKICINCNTQNNDSDMFCMSCGTSLHNAPIAPDQAVNSMSAFDPNIQNVTPQFEQQAEQPQYTQQQFAQPQYTQQQPDINVPFSNTANQTINYKPTGIGRFVSADEYTIATLENGVMMNIFSGEGVKKEDAIITNKRLYYNHKDGLLNISKCEEKVDLRDITGTKITSYSPFGTLVLAITFIIVGIIILCLGFEQELALFLIPSGLVGIMTFFALSKKHLKIEYSGGNIKFSVKKYGMKNIQAFQKCIYSAKDAIYENNNK